jgi:hypothetical protein
MPYVVPRQDRADWPSRHRCPAVVHVVRADHCHRRRLCQPDQGLHAAVLGVRQGPHRQHLLQPGAVPLRRPGPAPLHRMSTSVFTIAYSYTCNACPRIHMFESKDEKAGLKHQAASRLLRKVHRAESADRAFLDPVSFSCSHHQLGDMALHEAIFASACPTAASGNSGTLSVLDYVTGASLASFKPCAAPAHGTAVVETQGADGGVLFALQDGKPVLNCWSFQKVGE